MLSHGDLVELIDALKQKLYVAPPVGVERPTDGTGGPEDGNGLGIHGTGEGEGDKPKVPPALTDLQIALAVATKSRTLVNRMVAREKTVAEQYSRTGMETNGPSSAPARALIMQLVAVIGLLREIKRLENGPRWSGKGLKLLDPKSLLHLFENSMTYLFRADFDVADRARSSEAIYDELEQLFGLMAWLSWMCGFDFRSPVKPRYELGAEEHTRQLHANGYLSRLMPLVIDADCINDLRTAIENTTPRSPSAKVAATQWLNRNFRCGEQVFEMITAPSSELLDRNRELVEGGLAWIPGVSGQFAVVSQIGPATVRLWDLGRERGFASSDVKPLALSRPEQT